MTVLNLILLGVTVLLWFALVGTVLTLNDSDPAGNGLSYAFGVFMAIGLWVLLAGLLVMAAVRGDMPGWSKVAAVILVPASGVAALGAIHLMSGYSSPRWPAVVPIFVPALIIAFALWATVPSVRAAMSPSMAGGIAWGTILILSIAPWPAAAAGSREVAARRSDMEAQEAITEAKESEAKRQQNLATFQKLTPNSPLWEWMPFTFDNNELRDTALAGARHLASRQADAEALLEQGHWFPLVEMRNLDLDATPRFCALARQHLEKEARAWRTTVEHPPEYTVSAGQLEKYLPAMEWLAAHHCDLGSALAEIQSTVRIYPTSPERERFLDTLARLRSPR